MWPKTQKQIHIFTDTEREKRGHLLRVLEVSLRSSPTSKASKVSVKLYTIKHEKKQLLVTKMPK